MAKTYLKIQSNGEIENGAFTLIGASSKRGDNTKIGYYGSGLKYSISAMLRNKIDFKIFQGETEVLFATKEVPFRSEVYLAITVNGQETSLTTTMGGADWDKPFAPIREIYSNALDEDSDALLQKTEEISGSEGKTSFFIEYTEEVKHFFENYNLYFCNKIEVVEFSNDYASVFPKNFDGDLRLYRIGILCHHDSKVKALYNYNSQHFTINESRVANNLNMALYYVAAAWKRCIKNNLIQMLIDDLAGGNAGFYEHQLGWETGQSDFTENWFEVMKDGKYVPAEVVPFAPEYKTKDRIVLPINLLRPLFNRFPELDILGLSKKSSEVDYLVEDKPSEILVNKVIEAVAKLSGTRYKDRLNNINIIYVDFIHDDSIQGMAEDKNILLSTKLDTKPVDYIATVIIEENEHNITGFKDRTRNFQNHLFELYFDELLAKQDESNT